MTPSAAEVLVAYRETLPDFFVVDDVTAASGTLPVDAAWAVLRTAFTTPGASTADEGILGLAAMVLAADGDHGEQAFEELVLGTTHPGLFRHLAPLLRTISHERIYELVHAGLLREEPAAVVQTLRFIRAAWSGRFPPPLTAGQAEELDILVEELVERDDLEGELLAERRAWVKPVRA